MRYPEGSAALSPGLSSFVVVSWGSNSSGHPTLSDEIQSKWNNARCSAFCVDVITKEIREIEAKPAIAIPTV